MLAQGAFVRDVVCFTFYPFSLILEPPPAWHVLQPPLTLPNGADASEACRDAHCKRVQFALQVQWAFELQLSSFAFRLLLTGPVTTGSLLK